LDSHVARDIVNLLHSQDERTRLSRAISGLMKKGGREQMIEIISEYESK